MKHLKLLIVLSLLAAILIGCVNQPIAPTTQGTQPDSTTGSVDTTGFNATTGQDVTTELVTDPPTTAPDGTQPTQPTQTEPVTTVPATTEPTFTVPATTGSGECAHAYQTQTVAATCSESGYSDYTCTICGYSFREAISALGHDYGQWNTTAATCTKNGSRTRTCNRCSDKQTEILSASGHAYDAGTVLQKAASCSNLGTMQYTCNRCGGSYETTYQGCHTFGEPYKTTFSGIQVKCEDCGYTMTDFYTWRENSYSNCDKTAALYCDTIKLKDSVYTGALSSWSEKWVEWHDFLLDVLSAHGSGDVGLCIYEKLSDFGGTQESFMKEFNAFLDSFSAFYGWRPVMDGDAYIDGNDITLSFDSAQLFPIYEAGTNKLSSARKNAIVEDLVAFHIHKMGLRDGMQAYNSMGVICDYMYYNLLRYDYNYRYNSAFRGLTSGNTMCQGFSEIFQLFAQYCGLKVEIVEGTMMGQAHAWNRVTFSDGTQRYVDVTNLGYDYYILVPWEAMTYSHKLK